MAAGILTSGAVGWASLAPVRGREQGGHRPVVVVASSGYLTAVTTLALIIPATTTDRGWPNHIELSGDTGLDVPSWAMTEQVRTISRDRVTSISGHLDAACMQEIRVWLADFLDLRTA